MLYNLNRLQKKLLHDVKDDNTVVLYTGYDDRDKINYGEAYYSSALALVTHSILFDEQQTDGTRYFPTGASRSVKYIKHTFTLTEKGKGILGGL